MSDKIDFNTQKMSLNKEACFITITGPIHQENIKFINICPSRHGGLEYMPQKLTGEERGNKAVLVGDARRAPSIMRVKPGRPTKKQKTEP